MQRDLSLSALTVAALLATCPTARADSSSIELPTGQWISPTAAPHAEFLPLNPGLASLPSYTAGQAVTTASSTDGKTLLVLTSGYNQERTAAGALDPAASNEYV